MIIAIILLLFCIGMIYVLKCWVNINQYINNINNINEIIDEVIKEHFFK